METDVNKILQDIRTGTTNKRIAKQTEEDDQFCALLIELHPNFEQIAEWYLDAVEFPSIKSLMVWIGKYPEYKQELVEFTVAWILMELLPEQPRTLPDDFDVRGMEVIETVLNKKHNDTHTRHV